MRTKWFLGVVIGLGLQLVASVANAHEIWLEKSENSSVKVYLGEPGTPDSGEKINGLKNVSVFSDTPDQPLQVVQKDNHWLATGAESGDVRAAIDDLWQPWDMEEVPWWQFWRSAKQQGSKLFARAGRQETAAKTAFEFVPLSPEGHRFSLVFKGNAVANKEVTLLTPEGKETKLSTNSNGLVDVTENEAGTYMLSAHHSEDGETEVAGNRVDSVYYVTSLTFSAD